MTVQKKKRQPKYDPKLKIKGTFDEIVSVTVKETKEAPKKGK